MSYTHEAVIITPIALYETSSKLGRAFDPDVGGDKNFDMFLASADKPTVKTHCCCYVRITSQRAGEFGYLLNDGGKPNALHAMVVSEYETRWQGIEPPSLAECTEWLAQSDVEVNLVGSVEFVVLLKDKGLTQWAGE
jgi:hypothetical protein